MACALSDILRGIGPGAFVGVAGPSGAGKDSVMAAAREILRGRDEIVFPKRIVTREPDATEENIPLPREEFRRMAEEGGFALAWEAHNLFYALPVEIDNEIANGRVVVANVSRSVVPEIRRRYTRGLVALIDAPAHVRRERLAGRGRETAVAVEDRLLREVRSFRPCDADLVIQNGGRLEDAALALSRFISCLARH